MTGLMLLPSSPETFVHVWPTLINGMAPQAKARVVSKKIGEPISHGQYRPMDIEILDFGLSTPACHLHILDLNGKGEAIIVDKPRQAPA